MTAVEWWDGDDSNKSGPFLHIRRGLLLEGDLVQIPHSGVAWCGGSVKNTDYFDMGGQMKAKHMLLVDITLFRQREETRDTVVEEFMLGEDDNSIRLLIKRTGD